MKVVSNNAAPALTSGDMETVDMGISTNPEDQLMILNVLSNSLYTDKVSAVLREYGCNAFDANVEAGRGHQPIEVRLPNRLEAAVCIRDFGYGMTQEQILTVFCRLGRSTKRSSNEFTGMLGIGSKAGFAYGDSFTVTSYTGGTKAVYNCFREKGAPKMAKMLEVASDAPDGIEVKVPVRMEDVNEFVEKAERVYRYFKVRPIIHGAQVNFRDDERKFEGTGWRYTGSGSSYAVMGNVGYDLNAESMGGVAAEVKSLIDLGVELEFEIGDLEIAANREGLQYKDVTKKSVAERLAVLKKEVGRIFSDQIAAAPSKWEAYQMFGDIFEKRGDYALSQLRQIVGGHITWGGEQIKTARYYIGNKEKNDKVISITEYSKRSWGSKYQTQLEAEYCYASDKTQLCINDLPSKKHSPSRVKGFFEANPSMDALVVFCFLDDKTKDKFFKLRELEGVKTIDMSSIVPHQSLSAGPTGPSAHKKKHSAKAFVLDEAACKSLTDRSTKSLFWQTEDVDYKNDSGVYVMLDKFMLVQPEPRSTYTAYFAPEPMHFANHYVRQLREVGLLQPSDKIYAFKQTWVMEKPRLGPGWVPLELHLKNVVADLSKKSKLEQQISDYFATKNYQAFMNYSALDKIPVGNSLHALLVELKRMANPKCAKALLDYLHAGRGVPWVSAPAAIAPSALLEEMERKVCEDYPLLAAWASDRCGKLANLADSQIKIASDYISLVDSNA